MKIGVVGYGSIGKRHADNAERLGHEVMVYDPIGRRDFKFERNVYEWAQAVVIATPSYCHEAGLRAAVAHGKHVLIEKPISTSLGQLQELLDRAEAHHLIVMMGNNLRFHPCVKKAKGWLDGGMIGEPLWAQFVCGQESTKPLYLSDGVILNTGSHEVDVALHLLGLGTASIASARLTRSAEDVGGDDIADFIVEHANGCRSNFHVDFVTSVPARYFRIVGTDGVIYCDLIARFLCRRQMHPTLPDVQHVDNFSGPGSWDTDYLEEMSTFIASIETGHLVGASGHQGLHALELLLDVRKKAGL